MRSLNTVGELVQDRREQLKLTREIFADLLGDAVDYVRQLEEDSAFVDALTVQKLQQIAQVLGTSASALIPASISDLVAGVKIQGESSGIVIQGMREGVHYYTYTCLVRTNSSPTMIPLLVDVHETTQGMAKFNAGHAGSEFIYVMSGSVEMQWGDSTDPNVQKIEEGSSIYISPFVPHAFTSVGEQARLVAVNF
jgi:transcriptional regulator with XRE-family HTH domain